MVIPVTYCLEWQDGFGAQGWKLDRAINDAEVIAVTAYAGETSPTSVLVHDILDHVVSGFGLSGHRNEAMAAMQHGLRNQIAIRSSYEYMAQEILRGQVSGEPLESFLPDSLRQHLPAGAMTDDIKMQALITKLGRSEVFDRVITRFFELGELGVPIAIQNWKKSGLAYETRAALGTSLQALLVRGDRVAAGSGWNRVHGYFVLGNQTCQLKIERLTGGILENLSEVVSAKQE